MEAWESRGEGEVIWAHGISQEDKSDSQNSRNHEMIIIQLIITKIFNEIRWVRLMWVCPIQQRNVTTLMSHFPPHPNIYTLCTNTLYCMYLRTSTTHVIMHSSSIMASLSEPSIDPTIVFFYYKKRWQVFLWVIFYTNFY